MEEYLDIVDEQDAVIGRDTRANVHRGYKIHREVHVIVLNSCSEILVQKRAAVRKDRPGYYDASVGAHVSSGESYEQSAVRETQEELGFFPDKLIPIGKYNSFSERQRPIRQLYICYYEGAFDIDPLEVASISWMSLEEISSLVNKGEKFTQGFLKSIERLRVSDEFALNR